MKYCELQAGEARLTEKFPNPEGLDYFKQTNKQTNLLLS